jgi:hypothetical protein
LASPLSTLIPESLLAWWQLKLQTAWQEPEKPPLVDRAMEA